MRWLSCHFGTLRRNEQAYCGNLEQIWRARDTNQQHLSYWVFPAPHSPIIDTPQKVTKMIVLPLLLLIQSSDTFASNAFLEVEDREWRLFCGFWPPAHPPPLWQVPLTITLPIRAATAQNQPAASPPPSSSPSLATTPSLKNTCFNIWTDEWRIFQLQIKYLKGTMGWAWTRQTGLLAQFSLTPWYDMIGSTERLLAPPGALNIIMYQNWSTGHNF